MSFEFLLEKDIKKDSVDSILTPEDKILEGLKMYQSLYPYFLSIIGRDDFVKWYEDTSGIPYFSNCKTYSLLTHTFSDTYATTRCAATRLVNNFFFFPHTTVENVVNYDIASVLTRHKSFSDIVGIVSTDYENIVVNRYDIGGGLFPDHTFLTIRVGSYLIILQSFYYVYNINSKYGIILLSGNEITLFEQLMGTYKTIDSDYKAFKEIKDNFYKNIGSIEEKERENSIIDMYITEMRLIENIKSINKIFERYTGIDTEKHCAYISNRIETSPTYITIYPFTYNKITFQDNICQNLSYVLKFITNATDFTSLSNTDLFIILQGSTRKEKKYTILKAFKDNIDFSTVNDKFIKYTGLEFAVSIEKNPSVFGDGQCSMKYNNLYDINCLETLNINLLFTGVNYMFDLFECSDIIFKKYGDILDTYTGDTWSKEFYKKIFFTSKYIRDIYQRNRHLRLNEIVELVEEQIHLNEVPIESFQFLSPALQSSISSAPVQP